MQSEEKKRKVFVSLLGTGIYSECIYRYDEDGSKCKTRFIQYATLEMFHADRWDKDRDKVIIFLTDKAGKSNWDRSITSRKAGDSVVPYDSLEAVLVKAGYEDMLITKNIPDGKTEEEMWEIFDVIYGELQDGDELYVDITHAFRYLPMLMLVLMNYSKFLKNTEVKSLSYGNYEARVKSSYGVEEAPVMQLLPIVELMDWTLAASDFIKNGRTEKLLSITREKTESVTKDNASSQALKQYYGRMEGVVKKLSKYAEAIRMSNGKYVFDGLVSTKYEMTSSLDNYRYRALLPIVNKVIEEYKEKFTVGGNADSDIIDMKLILQISQWCLDKKLYQQFATLLQEGIVSYFSNMCVSRSADIKSMRQDISRYLSVKKKCKDDNDDNYIFVNDMDNKYPPLARVDKRIGDEFYGQYEKLAKWRNYLNHAWTTKVSVRDSAIIDDFEAIQRAFENLFLEKVDVANVGKRGKLFINFSNHPYSGWSDVQKKAFADFGEVKEIPFPPIDPDWSSEKINQEADKYCKQILSMSEKKDVTVHIMGEMTFCFAVVFRLKEAGIRCVASCAKRNVMEDNEIKLSIFDFVGYREY